jgi:hypothetical protein
MATFTFKPHAGFIETMANKEVDLDSDTFKAMLCTSSYVPNLDTHKYKSSVTNEITGTGYTATGQALTGVTWSYNSTTNVWTFDAVDPSWTSSTLTARVVVVYDSSPASDATRPIVGSGVFSEDVSSNAGPLTVQWGSTGLFTVAIPT